VVQVKKDCACGAKGRTSAVAPAVGAPPLPQRSLRRGRTHSKGRTDTAGVPGFGRSVSACRSRTPGRGALDGQGSELRVDAVSGLRVGEVEQRRAVRPPEARRGPDPGHQVRGTPSDLRDLTRQQARRNRRAGRSGGSEITPPPLHRQVQLTVRASLQHGRAMPEPSSIRPKADDPCGVRIDDLTGRQPPRSNRPTPVLFGHHERDAVGEPAGDQQQRETPEEENREPALHVSPCRVVHQAGGDQPGSQTSQADEDPQIDLSLELTRFGGRSTVRQVRPLGSANGTSSRTRLD